jgi:hypothetical protein
MKVNEFLQNFDVEAPFWNVYIGPEKWPIFGRFPLKHPTRLEEITSNMAATIGDVLLMPPVFRTFLLSFLFSLF